MSYWTPENIILGLERQDGEQPDHIIHNMLFNFEQQARKVLTQGGYGVDKAYLTPNDPEQDRITWLNEAYQLLDTALWFAEFQAVISLIEQANIRHYIEEGNASAVAISMAKLVAITLLPNDTDTQAIIKDYKRNHKAGSSKGGANKLGHKGASHLLIRAYFDDFVDSRLSGNEILERSAEQLAEMIYRGLRSGGNLSRPCISTTSIEYIDDANVIEYITLDRPEQVKKIKPPNMANIIREIKKEIQAF